MEIQSPTPMMTREGQPVTFVANISGGEKDVTPSIVWSVSAGVITDGQGTRRITVDSNGAGRDRQITADLWLGGYAAECSSQAPARTISVVPPSYKTDEFGEIPAEDEKRRFEPAVAAAMSHSGDAVYVIAYAGRNSVRGYTIPALRRIRTQVGDLGLPNPRIGTLDGGFREQPVFEVWIVPEGAELPKPTPTIDRKDIVYPGTPRKTAPRKP